MAGLVSGGSVIIIIIGGTIETEKKGSATYIMIRPNIMLTN